MSPPATSPGQRCLRWLITVVHRILDLAAHALFSLAHRGPCVAMPDINDLLLLDSATELARKIRTRGVSAETVVEAFIARSQQVNRTLNCVVDSRHEAALEDARAVDKRLAAGGETEAEIARNSPFLGVPFSTKDCIRVKDLLHTSGLIARAGVRGSSDSTVAARLRAAGGIPLSLTNVSECCMWWESNNPVHGRSNNPYDARHIVGGSSGGEACLLAAAGSPLGIGSDIGGSIRMPAFFCGVFGHKPSPGVVPIEGQYPEPLSSDQRMFLGIGPMSRFSIDLLPLLTVLAGPTASARLRLSEPVRLRDIRVFSAESCGGAALVSPVDPEIRAAVRRAATHLRSAQGCAGEEVVLAGLRKSAPIWFARMRPDDPTAPSFAAQLTNLKGEISVWSEFMRWMVGQSRHTFVALLTAVTEKLGVQYGSPAHSRLTLACADLRRELLELLGTNGVLIYPTHPTPAPFHSEPIIKALNFSYTGIFNVLGVPSTAVPMGLHSSGLPIGIQVVAAPDQDRLCLAVAAELERVFGGWVPPRITV